MRVGRRLVLSEELAQLVREEVSRVAARAAWPKLLGAKDIAAILGLELSAVRRRVTRSDFGRAFHIGRRVHVLREDFMAALRALRERERGSATRLRGCETPTGGRD